MVYNLVLILISHITRYLGISESQKINNITNNEGIITLLILKLFYNISNIYSKMTTKLSMSIDLLK